MAVQCQETIQTDISQVGPKAVYISGPMSGVKDNNAAAFDARRDDLAKLGYAVVSPVDLDRAEVGNELVYSDCLRRDVAAMLDCEYISFLPGWERSSGANLEKAVADAIGLKEIDGHGNPITQRNVLCIADSLTGGDRQQSYGHPAVDFDRTARFWSALFGIDVRPEQVGLAMVLLKVSREVNRHKDDNLIDMAGYVRTIEMIYDWKREHNAP